MVLSSKTNNLSEIQLQINGQPTEKKLHVPNVFQMLRPEINRLFILFSGILSPVVVATVFYIRHR
jgi:hypothetical protein